LISDLVYRLRALFRRSSMESDLDNELRAHFDRQVEKLVASGLALEEARRRARLELGGIEQVKEDCRDARGVSFIETTVQDLRYGLRQLRRAPGFAIAAVLTLALGIGATTAIFSVVDAVLLRSAPYATPSELVEITERDPESAAGEINEVSAGDLTAWQEQAQAFQGVAAYERMEFHALSGGPEPDEVWASPVTSNLFAVLGVNPARGRAFAAGETQVVVLSHEYWTTHLSSNPTVIGKSLALDGKPYTVIGIAPADFEFPAANTEMWVPLTFTAAERADHDHRRLSVIARLRSGVTVQQAQAQLDVIASQLAIQYPKTNAGWTAPVTPFKAPEVQGVLRAAILALLGAVVFMLMIVCANVASMLLARGATRQGEMAVRAALGAGRTRLVRQLLIESLLLAAAAGAAGLVLARWGLDVIVDLVPRYNLIQTQALHQISINRAVFGFAAALSVLTGVVVGLLPAARISRVDINDWLKEHGRTSSGSRGSRLQRALVVSEIALALVLLIGAGLMIQSFERLASAPTGFSPDHLLTVRVPLMNYKYSQGPQSAAFYREILRKIKAIPGVKAAGMANNLPFAGFHLTLYFPSNPNSSTASSGSVYVDGRSVSPGYFQAMGIPLESGRDFTETDNQPGARCVRIMNEALARRYWPGEDAVGRQVFGACPKKAPALIIGVVGDSEQDAVGSPAVPELYEPYAQHAWASFLVTFVVRTASDPLSVAAAVRQAVGQVDSNQPVIQVRTMEEVIAESLWRQHLSASMMGIFGAIALLLAAMGIYGVLAYSVSRRTHEIGIRSALGATRGDLLRMVIGEGLLLTLAGVGIGTLAALGLTRVLAGLLYGVRPRDPLTFVTLALLLILIALLAVSIPARRASKVDPLVALRHE
jgi:putative ABC transport system permease protein